MDSKVEKDAFEAYLNEARTWETSKVKELEKSKKTAWWVASASGVIAACSVLAVGGIALYLLKPIDPVVLRVDNTTGMVDVVKPLEHGKTNYKEVINKYFIQWYVRYREGYSRELAEDYYRNVGLMSGALEQKKYYDWFNPKNPDSPLKVYGNTARVEISILSTSFIKPHVALVRYIKKVERGNDAPEITHWAATVVFRYSSAPMKARDREINPLGFQCIEYRNDPDSMAVVTVPPPNHQPQAQTQPQGPVLFADPRPKAAAPAASPATTERGGK